MSLKSSLVVLFVGMAAAACTPKDKADGADGAAANASAVASTAPVPSATASTVPATAENDPLPSHSDVAKKVRKEINKQNYKSELDKLEKEIDQP